MLTVEMHSAASRFGCRISTREPVLSSLACDPDVEDTSCDVDFGLGIGLGVGLGVGSGVGFGFGFDVDVDVDGRIITFVR
ncbi:hypothetical protein WT01_10895 [Burkholderia cepacia]|uniref:hypothetical protein n=1 Tax=Burkholderia cepacia TaxID=292 RepID=UPI00075CBB0A|nr:hypothetical protein [Burkholderia cepacia]KVL60718.1 hypothetical protein WT01_10895 [Burkholderia cepacia]